MDKLTFLGTSDSLGVPRVYCCCAVCEEARISGENRRMRSSILIHTSAGELLLDCGPDWTAQMEQMRIKKVSRALITHAHFDHIGGLPEWADACRCQEMIGQVYAPAEVIQAIRSQFPWLEQHLTYHDISGGFAFGNWNITPWKVCHGRNGFSYSYFFLDAACGFRWAYCSDAIHLQEQEKKPFYGLQLLILGTNFYHEQADFHTRSVYDMIEGQRFVVETGAEQVYFTHMSHEVNVLSDYPLLPRVKLARQWQQVNLQSCE